MGSQAYGTNTPESDTDIKGVYIQDLVDIGSFEYKDQIQVNKDECYYEVKRFCELLCSSNPTVLELLFTPENCILEKHPIFDILVNNRNLFISKQCRNSFIGYAMQQISKADGLEKKVNWEKSRIERKLPSNFMYVLDKNHTTPINEYCKLHKLNTSCIGLTKLNHVPNTYCVYYDHIADLNSDNPRFKECNVLGYKGLCNESQVLVSEVPFYQEKLGLFNIYYNEQEFQKHCRDYNSYQTWLKERNEARYVDYNSHGDKLDGKNLMHCIRLIDVAEEIAKTGTFSVKRPNAEYLLKIRRGQVDLHEIINIAKSRISELDKLFEQSNLPDKIDHEKVNDLLKEIRKTYK